MNPLNTDIFFNDPWWLTLIKAVAVVLLVLTWQIFNVWYERRLLGKMQHRLGPIMNGPFGLGQTLGDGLKFLLKEDFAPGMVDKVLYTVAPMVVGVAAFASWSVIPLGGEVDMFGVHTRLQVVDLPASALVILAMSSVAVYGFVLAGWSSNSPYSLLGSLRASAQMVSYEISMGLSFAAVFLYAQSMSTSEIADAQAAPLFGGNILGLQSWYWLLLLPSFVIFVISMSAESNRVPFDLPECESELVSGHITEYTGFRYAIFYLGEYINATTLSAVMATLFMGGYHAFWPFNLIPGLDGGWWGLLWFVLKVQFGFSLFVWARASLPRVRYDQLMDIGWKWLIPISVVWLTMIAIVRKLSSTGVLNMWWMLGLAALLGLGLVALLFLGGEEEVETTIDTDGPFDAFAGGYPIPPMPGQSLPEHAGIIESHAVIPGGSAKASEDPVHIAKEY